jgi:CRISPR-associated protein Cas5h
MEMKILECDWIAPYGHFSHPEMGAEGMITFRLPPRTAILGLIAAILGLPKNTGVAALDHLALSVRVRETLPKTFWHSETQLQFNLHGTPQDHFRFPHAFQHSEPQIKLLQREWLLQPRYTLWIGNRDFPEFSALVTRVRKQRFVFPPTMGQAMMMSHLSMTRCFDAPPCPADGQQTYSVSTLWNLRYGTMESKDLNQSDFTVDYFPRSVDAQRRFHIEAYGYRHAATGTLAVQPFAVPLDRSPILKTPEGEFVAWL